MSVDVRSAPAEGDPGASAMQPAVDVGALTDAAEAAGATDDEAVAMPKLDETRGARRLEVLDEAADAVEASKRIAAMRTPQGRAMAARQAANLAVARAMAPREGDRPPTGEEPPVPEPGVAAAEAADPSYGASQAQEDFSEL